MGLHQVPTERLNALPVLTVNSQTDHSIFSIDPRAWFTTREKSAVRTRMYFSSSQRREAPLRAKAWVESH